MNEDNLIRYYNKFNEDKRLTRRHGIVEYTTSIKYIHEYLKEMDNPKVIDIGAGSGKYSCALYDEGYDVTSVELVRHNLMTLKGKNSNIKAYLGNATDLSRFRDNSFDVALLFGPMYHLISEDDKIRALLEAKRIVKKGGLIFISYYMNEYAIITHGFRDNNIISSIKDSLVDDSYHVTPCHDDLYSMVRIEDINRYKDKTGLQRVKILAQDGPSDYLRSVINKMDDETFAVFLDYHLKTCERYELLGASSHVMDILKKID